VGVWEEVMKKIISIILITIVFGSVFAQDLTALKKRIAVVNFEDKAGYGHNIGQGVSDMLVTKLVESGQYIVVERNELDAILKEQGLGQSGLVTQQSAAKVGQLLGVEMMVTGSISEFGEKKSKVGGGIGSFGGFNIGVATKTARVAVDIRLVNTSTGEIIAAKSADGEDSSTGLDNVGIEDVNFHNSKTWDNTQLGIASRIAIEKCVDYVNEGMSGIPWEGKIIKASGGTVFMKPGSKGGVEPGMKFSVYRPGEELIDPDTGLSLGSEESKIGQIEYLSDIADGKAGKAIVKSGTGMQAGDLIRIK
jgi:curli biogenesis system outer membrane secretion channel CsgG